MHNPGHVALLTETTHFRFLDVRLGARGWLSEANIWPKCFPTTPGTASHQKCASKQKRSVYQNPVTAAATISFFQEARRARGGTAFLFLRVGAGMARTRSGGRRRSKVSKRFVVQKSKRKVSHCVILPISIQ